MLRMILSDENFPKVNKGKRIWDLENLKELVVTIPNVKLKNYPNQILLHHFKFVWECLIPLEPRWICYSLLIKKRKKKNTSFSPINKWEREVINAINFLRE